MTPRWIVVTVVTSIVGIGCSHAQPKETPRPVVAAAPAPPKVEAPPTPAPSETGRAESDGDEAIFFQFDASLLRDDARPILQKVAAALRANPRAHLRIEGNCDERGTTEYNLALGEARARAAKRYLVALGISASRVDIRSYGSERPKDSGHDESAWSRNRRDDFIVSR
jgi:peptidoglycan-associated lipoprotein